MLNPPSPTGDAVDQPQPNLLNLLPLPVIGWGLSREMKGRAAGGFRKGFLALERGARWRLALTGFGDDLVRT